MKKLANNGLFLKCLRDPVQVDILKHFDCLRQFQILIYAFNQFQKRFRSSFLQLKTAT